MSERLNFYSGTFSIEAANADARAGDLGNFDADLASIEYIVDVHAKRNALIEMINGVYIRYAAIATGDDFLQVIGGGDDTTHLESVRTYQAPSTKENVAAVANIKSFDFNYNDAVDGRSEVIGLMPAECKGVKFLSQVDSGADNVHLDSLSGNVVYTGLVNHDGTHSFAQDLDVVFSKNLETNLLTASGYNSENLLVGAIARALSAQFPNNAQDENLLRILVEHDSYINILKMALQGCTTTTGSTVSVNSLLHSNEVSEAYGMNMQDLLDKVFDEQLPSSRPLGHEIMLAIFDKAPASLGNDAGVGRTVAYLNEDNTTDKRPWEVVQLGANPSQGDMLRLAYMDNLKNPATGTQIDVVLQFVLKTKLTMVLRDGTTLSTMESPSSHAGTEADPHVAGYTKILLNVVFSRSDDQTAAVTSLIAGETPEST